MSEPIRAAGVVLLRAAPVEDVDAAGSRVLVVHRPVQADWSLPKGKLEPGEPPVVAAVRECEEETGYTPVLHAPLETIAYSVDGRPKLVTYWRARIAGDEGFAPDDEVDEIRWVSAAEADGLLNYAADRRLVAAAIALPDTVPLVVLRHAQAVKRAQFDGDDDALRPLTGKGRSQAKALVPVLTGYGVQSVHASTAYRCQQTVARLAREVGAPVVAEPALSEEGHRADPAAAAGRTVELARTATPLVVCGHRPVLPAMFDALAGALGLDPRDRRWQRAWTPKLAPGGYVVIHRAFDDPAGPRVVAVEAHADG